MGKKLKIGIVGSRTITDYLFVKRNIINVLDRIGIDIDPNKIEIVSGGAIGVDTFAQQFAREHGLTITIHYPDWNIHGKNAGFIRNQYIVDDSDILIALIEKRLKSC